MKHLKVIEQAENLMVVGCVDDYNGDDVLDEAVVLIRDTIGTNEDIAELNAVDDPEHGGWCVTLITLGNNPGILWFINFVGGKETARAWGKRLEKQLGRTWGRL